MAAAFYGVSRLGRGTIVSDVMTISRLPAGERADFRASLLSWNYLFDAEGVSLLVWLVPFAAALGLQLRPGAARQDGFPSPLVLAAAGFAGVYLIFVVDSDLRHGLIVCGRHIRQLAPFLILGFGLGMDRLCARTRHGRALAAAAAAALAANALMTFALPFSQQFPRDFKARAQAVLRSRPPITDGASYYRLVNVDHYIVDPEVLPREPVETLLASRHPLEYLPYLYDGESSREKKRLRLSIDHRMRLVRMAVPEAERIRGDAYGMVTLSLELPGGQGGRREPLLSAGPAGNGDLFFVIFPTDTRAELGFESMGQKVLASAPFDFVPGARHSVQVFSGALMPAEDHLLAGEDPAAAYALRQFVYAAVDGRTMIEAMIGRHPSEPWQVYAGVNTVGADSAGAQYDGPILGAVRGGLPPAPESAGKKGEFGSVGIRFAPPLSGTGTAEPLVVVGYPGRAVLGYVRFMADGTSIFGVEVRGTGAFESKPMFLAREGAADVGVFLRHALPARGLARVGPDAARHPEAAPP